MLSDVNQASLTLYLNYIYSLKYKTMIKILGLIATIGGAIALILGILGVFGDMNTGISPWAFLIIGIIFFFAGLSLLKNSKEIDTVAAGNS